METEIWVGIIRGNLIIETGLVDSTQPLKAEVEEEEEEEEISNYQSYSRFCVGADSIH